MCTKAEYQPDVGMGVWDYVELIKEIRCTECGELIDVEMHAGIETKYCGCNCKKE